MISFPSEPARPLFLSIYKTNLSLRIKYAILPNGKTFMCKSIFHFQIYPENVKCRCSLCRVPNTFAHRQIIFAASFCQITMKIQTRRKIQQTFCVNICKAHYWYKKYVQNCCKIFWKGFYVQRFAFILNRRKY